MTTKIFLSYRRDDAAGHAGWLADRLRIRFGPDAVFMDVDTIGPGSDWVEVLRNSIYSCAAMVVLIGPRWLTARSGTMRRLEDPDDVVATEIAAALDAEKLVVPVLLRNARMPSAKALPPRLAGLPRRQALELRDSRWEGDVAMLIARLSAELTPVSADPAAAVHDLAARQHNLPAALTTFVGREADLAAVRARLAEARLLTLLGEGGCGKTRLALEAAAWLLADYPDGVRLIELAAVTDTTTIASVIAGALEFKEPAGDLIEQLGGYLAPRRVLLVVDNCEHVSAAVGQVVASLLRAAPQLRVLATSRQPLAVPGEVTWRVAPLEVPPPDLASVTEMAGYEAVRLFVDRARAASQGFELTASNSAAVAQICSRVDGIPLAIELAAARVPALGAAEIAERLRASFRLLKVDGRIGPARQQTLEAAIDWSHRLLEPGEQVCFRRLAVFLGGFTLAAAGAVCAGEDLDEFDVVDHLTALVDKSLIAATAIDDVTRYRMLETVRDYALARLREAEETAIVCAAHARYYVEFAERARPELNGAERGRWLGLLDAERGNLRAALEWAIAHETSAGLGLAVSLWQFFYFRGYLREGRRAVEDALSGGDDLPLGLRAAGLRVLGVLAWRLADLTAAQQAGEQALALYQELDDPTHQGRCLADLGNVAQWRGDHASARDLHERSLALCRAADFGPGIRVGLNNLGEALSRLGRFAEARDAYESVLDAGMAAENDNDIAIGLSGLASTARELGDLVVATELRAREQTLRQKLGDRLGLAECLDALARIRCDQGDHVGARAHAEQSLGLYRDVGDRRGEAYTLDTLSRVATGEGDHLGARRCTTEAAALFRALGDRGGLAQTLTQHGVLLAADGDVVGGGEVLREALRLSDELQVPQGIMRCFAALAAVANAGGEYRDAAYLLGAADRLREELGVVLTPVVAAVQDRQWALIGEGLGEPDATTARSHGRTLRLSDAVSLALGGRRT